MQADGQGRGAARKASALFLLAALLAVVLAGCGSSSSKSSSASTGKSTSASNASSSTNPGLAHAQQVVAQYKAMPTSYPLPTQPVKGVAALKGKTVMYIPLIQAIPAFAITAQSMKAALSKVGITTVICDGGANPTTVAACVGQAVSRKYAGVVTDAIPFEMASHAFQSAESAGLHVLITDQINEPQNVNGDKLAYQPGNINQPQLIADWIIADSKGKANAVIGMESDSPSSIAYITQGLEPEFKSYCSGCNVKVLKMTASTPDQIASAVNSALISDPGAQYYYSEFEDDLQGVEQGVQQAGKTSSVKVEFATATIAGLTKLKQGQGVAAEVGDDVNYEGWVDADEMLRMMVGQPVISEQTPERIFDSSNIGSLTLTPAAQASGQWYGDPTAFQSGFEKLWGVS